MNKRKFYLGEDNSGRRKSFNQRKTIYNKKDLVRKRRFRRRGFVKGENFCSKHGTCNQEKI
jgi:hypothetical protein